MYWSAGAACAIAAFYPHAALRGHKPDGTRLRILVFSPCQNGHAGSAVALAPVVFARQLRTEARTVAHWEQGVSKPNAQAAILMKLVERHPHLLEEIATL